jgi:acyl carrier protein
VTEAEIYQRLTTIFQDVLDDDELVLEQTLTADDVPQWDSLSHVRLILAVQKEFGVKFSAAHVAGLKDVGGLASLVQARLAQK